MINILIVEDANLVRITAVEWLKIVLEENNIVSNVFSSHDDISTLSVLSKEKIDMIVLDMILKSSDGSIVNIEKLIKDIKETNKNIKIISVSGHVDNEIIINCVNNNLLEKLIYKPVDYDQLLDIIKEVTNE